MCGRALRRQRHATGALPVADPRQALGIRGGPNPACARLQALPHMFAAERSGVDAPSQASTLDEHRWPFPRARARPMRGGLAAGPWRPRARLVRVHCVHQRLLHRERLDTAHVKAVHIVPEVYLLVPAARRPAGLRGRLRPCQGRDRCPEPGACCHAAALEPGPASRLQNAGQHALQGTAKARRALADDACADSEPAACKSVPMLDLGVCRPSC